MMRRKEQPPREDRHEGEEEQGTVRGILLRRKGKIVLQSADQDSWSTYRDDA